MTDRKDPKTHDPKTVRSVLILLGCIILIGLGLRLAQNRKSPAVTEALFIINSGSITVEIADTPEKKELGLGKRDSLEARHGMYFPFPTARKWLFWMKGMRFPLDAIWIRDGIVVDVTYDAQPPSGDIIQQFSPSEDADAVLEINAGEATELNVRKGDTVRIRY